MLSELKLRNTTAFSSLLFCYDGKQADNNKLALIKENQLLLDN
jgi:hypothetical protein